MARNGSDGSSELVTHNLGRRFICLLHQRLEEGVLPLNERDAHRKRRADVRNADAHRIRSRTSIFRVLLCLPTAPTLPIEGNGDFGTSPFFGQRSNKLCLLCLQQMGIPDVRHKGARGSKRRTPSCRPVCRGDQTAAPNISLDFTAAKAQRESLQSGKWADQRDSRHLLCAESSKRISIASPNC
jgi:hypothetical protein